MWVDKDWRAWAKPGYGRSLYQADKTTKADHDLYLYADLTHAQCHGCGAFYAVGEEKNGCQMCGTKGAAPA